MTDNMLNVSEIFFSIQGEGTRSGMPCAFVRLAGCNLQCHYCDTAYARQGGQSLEISQIIDRIKGFGANLVQITGGEPLLQPGVHSLMRQLCEAGRCVLLETNGACDISGCDARVVRIMDLKTPGSGQEQHNLWSNIECLTAADEIQFVICDRNDYQWARRMIARYDLSGKVAAVLLSAVATQPPGDGESDLLRDMTQWVLADRLPVRIQVQLHKLIWPPGQRGV